MEELIAKRYVNALIGEANSEQKRTYSLALNALSKAFDDKDIAQKMSSPLISKSDKTSFILDAIKDGADSKLENFIKILGEHDRLNLLPIIAKSLIKELQKELNRYEGVVSSSEKLDKESLNELEETLKKYTGSDITLTQEESTVDGLRVRVDDLGIEVSFSKERVKEQLIDFITKSL